jgi:1-acyl-sn-glycerol-3-phosphate acyltransferase
MRNLVRTLIRFLVPRLTRITIQGGENIQPTGSYLVAANHLGLVDALIVFLVTDRWDLFFFVGEKWQKIGFMRWLGKHLNFVFVDRNNPDIPGMRRIIKLMQEGHILIMTPEGTRSRTGLLLEGKPGVSYLAAKLGYPIVPVGVSGSSDANVFGSLKRLRRASITATAGRPFTLPRLPKQDREAALQQHTDEIMCQIARLLPEEQRGFYRDHPRLKELLQEK